MLAYEPDSMIPVDWQSAEPVPGAGTALGLDLDQRLVFYLDGRRRLVALDLEARIARPYVEAVRLATLGPDGSAYAVDSAGRVIRVTRRAATVLPARYDALPRGLFGTLNGQVLAVTADSSPSLRLLSVEQTGDPVGLPGTLVAATYWGEMVAVAAKDQVSFLRPATPDQVRRIALPDSITALAFSPSGHRLYALTEAGHLITLDRFSGERVGLIRLPGRADAVRVDPTGRWLLLHPTGSDSVWTVDLSTRRITGSVPSRWTDNLPLVAGTSTLLAAEEDDLIAWSLAAAPPTATAEVRGGAKDEWLPVAWVPPHRAPVVAAEVESALLAQDSAIAAALPAARGRMEVFLQVSSSQNPDWAEDLARQLADDGFPAQVWQPDTEDEGYRVVVGPYTSRDEAEEVGRRLNRPYFVVTSRRPAGR